MASSWRQVVRLRAPLWRGHSCFCWSSASLKYNLSIGTALAKGKVLQSKARTWLEASLVQMDISQVQEGNLAAVEDLLPWAECRSPRTFAVLSISSGSLCVATFNQTLVQANIRVKNAKKLFVITRTPSCAVNIGSMRSVSGCRFLRSSTWQTWPRVDVSYLLIAKTKWLILQRWNVSHRPSGWRSDIMQITKRQALTPPTIALTISLMKMNARSWTCWSRKEKQMQVKFCLFTWT